MSSKRKGSRRYAVCIKNEGNEASLERNKLYVVLPDRKAEADGLLRVIDEDGEDYLYPSDWFVAVELPKLVEQSLLKHPDRGVVEQPKLTSAFAPAQGTRRGSARAFAHPQPYPGCSTEP